VRFLADMGVDVRVVEWLRGQGYDAVHLREEGLHRAPDEQVFTKALAEDRVVLTFDLDFGDLAALTRDRSAA
jgi:predicted nuclease of predicted toxin-antitoxin system